ncbi:hypothetical protein MRB53_011191 [Persea americana]|uniref:Uncharacterized protein n=1 Tax=Persea americana TaxID=3435 RepID=A0ACC2LU30_PERAE|nr:hypothetical protein MRB53_011191 [Persea americana]
MIGGEEMRRSVSRDLLLLLPPESPNRLMPSRDTWAPHACQADARLLFARVLHSLALPTLISDAALILYNDTKVRILSRRAFAWAPLFM